ncbi:MAG: hypothetical protein LBO20_01770, partial [Bifidobacteriaceae bacterium]|nr:hypothetical protein [Bifidobacteriaceae bacterium]
IFFGVQEANVRFVSSATGIEAPRNSGGWSVFVGSNWDHDGGWNHEDSAILVKTWEEAADSQECHNILMREGLERYKSYGAGGTASLLVRKAYQFSSLQASTYNARSSITGYANSRLDQTFDVYILCFITVLFLLSGRQLYRSARRALTDRRVDPTVLFIAVLMLGFFFSHLLVESAPRYAQIMYPALSVLAVLSLRRDSARRLPS